MEAILPYALGLAVFGLFVVVMLIKEKRTQSRPPEHPCHQIQPCRCKNKAADAEHLCTHAPDQAE